MLKRVASRNSLDGEVDFCSVVVEQFKLKNKNTINISRDLLERCIGSIVYWGSYANNQIYRKKPYV